MTTHRSPNSINNIVYLQKITYPGATAENYYVEAEKIKALLKKDLLPDVRLAGKYSGPEVAVILAQEKHPERAEKDYCIHAYYIEALLAAGLCPRFVIYDRIKEQLAQIRPSGILLIGGCFDLPRDWYASPKPSEDLDKRGAAYLEMLDYAQENELPLLGICAGMQALAGKFGALLTKGVEGHSEGGDADAHYILPAPGSLLAEIAGSGEFMTNSKHREAVVDKIYDRVKITAKSTDGVVEAVELKQPWTHFVLGVQWHPEFFARKGDRPSLAIFENFAGECRLAAGKLKELRDDCFVVDLMYAGTAHNMTGRAVYRETGPGNRALVHKDLYEKLLRLIPFLKEHHLKLKIFDAYRPPLAHKKLLEVIPRQGFFAQDPSSSPHCRGTAVDVALCDENGRELPYPTAVDAYTPQYAKDVQAGKTDAFFEYLQKARHDYQGDASPEALANRDALKRLMEHIGLKALPHEWWHYELPDGRSDKYPVIDF